MLVVIWWADMVRAIGIKEFRDRATHYLGGDETLEIQRNGQTIGHYIPMKQRNLEKAKAASAKIDAVFAELADKGIDEETFMEAYLGLDMDSVECK